MKGFLENFISEDISKQFSSIKDKKEIRELEEQTTQTKSIMEQFLKDVK